LILKSENPKWQLWVTEYHMAILETLTFNLAPIVAKSILALWFRSEDFAVDASSDLIDLVRSASGNIRAQQRLRRQFEEIGERVADSFVRFLEVEAHDLPEHSQNSIVLTVVETLKNVPIDSRLLAEVNLDATKLFQNLERMHPCATNLLNDSERDLYHRMLRVSCDYIVNIASGLPHFSERVLAEILNREDRIIHTVEQVIVELRQIYENSTQNNQEIVFARLENDYLSSVVSQLGKLELFGVGRSVIGRRYGLDSAYVSLRVNTAVNRVRVSEDYAPRLEFASTNASLALTRAKRIVIRGEAGSGKTTLLQWIAVRSATDTFPSDMQEWRGCTPFLLRLRQFADTLLPEAKDFIKAVNPLLAGHAAGQRFFTS